jgi:hypothetical protein
MKRIVIFLTTLALLATGCQKQQKFTVSGTLWDAGFPTSAESIAIVSDAIDTPFEAIVEGDAFQIKGAVKKPVLAQLKASGQERLSKQFILEEGAILFKDGSACGTPLNDAILQFSNDITKVLRESNQNLEDSEEALENTFFSFVAEHKDDPCAIFAILKGVTFLTPEAVVRLIGTASSAVQQDATVIAWKERMQHLAE